MHRRYTGLVSYVRSVIKTTHNGMCPLPLAEIAREQINQIKQTTRYMPAGGNFKVGDQIFRTWLAGVDPSFAEIFTVDFLQGTKSSLTDHRSVWINEELKQKVLAR